MAIRLKIREMTIDDYENVHELWSQTQFIGLSDADSREMIDGYLKRNIGSSFVAYDGDLIVGAVLGGSDSRRGFINHLAVRDSHRRLGIGKQLVDRCIDALKEQGMTRCHIVIFRKNTQALEFWKKTGWRQRDDLVFLSKNISNS